MNFVSTRIITADIKRLVRFYERITGTPLTMFTEDFAELNTPSATLAIGSTRTLELFGGDVGRAADSHTAIIEFLVDDVDAEYRKLADVIKNALVQEPTTMPWGNRSLLFRDPDGNLVNFFTPSLRRPSRSSRSERNLYASVSVCLSVQRNCVRTVSHAPRNPGSISPVTGTRACTSLLCEVVDRECVGEIQCASARTAGVNFEACSLNDRRVAARTSIHRDVA
jgi:catechol 2,3-dioxygenase-like lactoylglutathione lyase family enzyme